MNNNPPVVGALLLSLGMIAAGSVVVASKVAVETLPPFTAASLRYGLAAAVLLPWAWRRHGWPRLDRRDFLVLLAQTVVGSLGFSLLLLLGLRQGAAAPASVAAGSLPLMVMAGTCLARRRPPSPRLAGAAALAAAGVMVAGRDGAIHPLVFAAIACEAAFVSLDRIMRRPPPPLMLSALLCLGGALLTLPGALVERWPPLPWPVAAGMALIWHALVGTVGGFVCWYAGTARLGAAAAVPYTALFPLTGLVAAPLVLGGTLDPPVWAGGLLVVVAIAVAPPPGRNVSA